MQPSVVQTQISRLRLYWGTMDENGGSANRKYQSQRSRKRMLAVRAMAGETSWLDGLLRWRDGRVVWDVDGVMLPQEAASIALAHRRLVQIARLQRASRRTIGDVDTWLAERYRRLDEAKYLHGLRAADFDSLGRAAANRDAGAINTLVSLLAAQALCIDGMTAAPSALLFAAGESALTALATALRDEAMPDAGRALAALVLGAIEARHPENQGRGAGLTGWSGRAFSWGRRFGLPQLPAVIVILLEDENGVELAGQFSRAVEAQSPFALPPLQVREMLACGVKPRTVVTVVEALAEIAPLAERVFDYRALLPEPQHHREVEARQMRADREEGIRLLTRLLHRNLPDMPDPELPRLVGRFVEQMLGLGPFDVALREGTLETLNSVLELPRELRLGALRILLDYHTTVWQREKAVRARDTKTTRGWLGNVQSQTIDPLLNILRGSGDLALTRRIFELAETPNLGFIRWLGEYPLPDREAYQLSVAIMAEFRFDAPPYWLGPLLDDPGATREVRPALRQVLQAIKATPADRHDHLVEVLLNHLPEPKRTNLQRYTALLIAMVPRLLRFSHGAHDFTDCACFAFVHGVLALEEEVPDVAVERANWLYDTLLRMKFDQPNVAWPLSGWLTMAAQLAGDSDEDYRRIVLAALQRRHSLESYSLDNLTGVLRRYPSLRLALAHIVGQQPERCFKLLRELTLVLKLGPEVLAPLADLDRAPDDDEPLAADWAQLIALAPQLEAPALDFVYARQIVGSAGEMPSGIRRVVELPAKLERELEYLIKQLAANPDQPPLARRVENQRLRLADRERLLSGLRQEATEALGHHTAEAQLSAAEHQVRACYRARLELVAGPLPPGLAMDHNMINAALLTVDIDRNRKLLLRLLRAYLAGDKHWPQNHPANRAFLTKLEQHGVDLGVWLSSSPRIYKLPQVDGGKVRLHLERDPLAVLQMGNYFDTCLSFGHINSFSTVANAAELNKRVIYAADGKGHIVGRKLIGISTDFKLLGFRTYTSLFDQESNVALRDIFLRYCTTFAEQSGLTMADDGEIPRLLAEAWYNDGVVPWHDADDERPPRQHSAVSR